MYRNKIQTLFVNLKRKKYVDFHIFRKVNSKCRENILIVWPSNYSMKHFNFNWAYFYIINNFILNRLRIYFKLILVYFVLNYTFTQPGSLEWSFQDVQLTFHLTCNETEMTTVNEITKLLTKSRFFFLIFIWKMSFPS